MKKSSLPLYDLTPLGKDWGISERILEIAFQTLALIVFRPLIAILNLVFFGLPKRHR